jgi:hypothetical protein
MENLVGANANDEGARHIVGANACRARKDKDVKH